MEIFQFKGNRCKKNPQKTNVTHSAELAGKNENAPLKQHAGIELEQVPHIDGHNQLRQVPLQETHTRHTPTMKEQQIPFTKGIYLI